MMKPGVIFHLGPTHMLDEQQTVVTFPFLFLEPAVYTPLLRI